MQLLPPQQVQNNVNAEEALRISRIKTLRESEESLRISIAKAEADFQRTLADNHKQWEREWSEYQEEVKRIKKNIHNLIAEEISIAIPFNILKEGSDNRLETAQHLLAKVRKQDEDNETLKELLEEKLIDVGDREEEAKGLEAKLLIRESYLGDRKKEIDESSDRLAISIKQFDIDVTQKRKDLRDRETGLNLKEKTLESQGESFLGRERDIQNREKRIRDEREVLQRAWDEIKRKDNRSPSRPSL